MSIGECLCACAVELETGQRAETSQEDDDPHGAQCTTRIHRLRNLSVESVKSVVKTDERDPPPVQTTALIPTDCRELSVCVRAGVGPAQRCGSHSHRCAGPSVVVVVTNQVTRKITSRHARTADGSYSLKLPAGAYRVTSGPAAHCSLRQRQKLRRLRDRSRRHARERNHRSRIKRLSSTSARAATDRRTVAAATPRDSRSLAHHVSGIRSLRRSRRAWPRHSFQTRPLVGSVQPERPQRRLPDQGRQAVHDPDGRQFNERRAATRADAVRRQQLSNLMSAEFFGRPEQFAASRDIAVQL